MILVLAENKYDEIFVAPLEATFYRKPVTLVVIRGTEQSCVLQWNGLWQGLDDE